MIKKSNKKMIGVKRINKKAITKAMYNRSQR